MKKLVKIVIIIVVLIIIGFLLGFYSKITSKTSQTLLGCPCDDNLTGERPCNSISNHYYIFNLILFGIEKDCSGKEIIICERGIQKNAEHRFDKCTYNLAFFGKR